MSAIISGFSNIIGKIFGHPLDFLSGKSCSSACGPTWDLICYVDNFCIANLLKLALVAILFYMGKLWNSYATFTTSKNQNVTFLLFFYLVYKLGICQCMIKNLCKTMWACVSTWFSIWEYGCYYLCHKLRHVKRKRRRLRRDIEKMDSSSSRGEEDENSTTFYDVPRSLVGRRKLQRHDKRDHLRRSLRPQSHRTRVGISGNSVNFYSKRKLSKHSDDQGNRVHHIRVTRTSKFARKGANNKRGYTHIRRL